MIAKIVAPEPVEDVVVLTLTRREAAILRAIDSAFSLTRNNVDMAPATVTEMDTFLKQLDQVLDRAGVEYTRTGTDDTGARP